MNTARPIDAQAELLRCLNRVATEDENALQELYKRTSPQLFGVLLRILNVESIAEEALQEVYIRIWQRAGDYRAERGKPLTWLTSIARNHALDLLRKQRSRENLEVALNEETGSARSDYQFDPSVLAEQSQILGVCLDRLEETTSACIVSAYVEGLSHQELSERHETPLGTIKSWIRRGLLSLKECIHELS